MKNKNNSIELLMYSKELLQWSHKEVIKWFATFIQPAVNVQEAYVRKLFPESLENSSPIYLS